MDPYFRVEVCARTENPQTLIWLSAHQCVCEGAAVEDKHPEETKAGEYAVKHLLKGGRGHYSPLEAPQISFNIIGFPHSVMQQLRTHRIAVHFSVQSFRYTGKRITDAAENKNIEEVFYLRPVGFYADRQGKKYEYTAEQRRQDLDWCLQACDRYKLRIDQGFSEEHARGLIPFDVRQYWVMSANVRSLMHILDLRMQKSAQLEAQQLCELIYPHFEEWVPQMAEWYTRNRKWKPRLAP